jgi:pimeloyl-ACP methyl ester carboxylesterase
MRIVKGIAYLVVALIALGAGAFFIAAWLHRDIPANVLEAKYGNAQSKFIAIDGVRVHYRDEGQKDGPAVLLIHAHFDSLLAWDPWVDALKDKYRVVRFDMTSHGLTGPDPSGDYTLERTVALTEKFAAAMQLTRFSIAGTSMGGTIAIHYAAKNPEQIEKMILLSPGALNTRVRGRSTPRPLPAWIDIATVITPRMVFERLLTGGFGDPSKIKPELVDQWWELMRREGQRKAELTRTRQYVSGDVDAKIKTISVPVLVMWGEKNPVVTVDQAKQFTEMLTAAPSVKLIVYPGVGHMAVHEAPTETARDARAFFDGEATQAAAE